MNIEEFATEYEMLGHAIQSGVALDQSRGSQDGTPKHLRVGVNLALVEIGVLAKFLIDKGVCTEQEYFEAVIEKLREELARYEARLGVRLG